jgi:hypothetical protein
MPIAAKACTNCVGITIHWVDDDFCQRSAVLELEPMTGDRTGRNLGEAFEKTLITFGIWPRIAHITTDGGSDFLLMLRLLEPSIPGFIADDNGLRCLAHILHNAVQSMFKALHCEGFENEEVALDRLDLKPAGNARQDLSDASQQPTPPPPEFHPSGGHEVTDFEVTLNKVRRLCFGVRCSDKRRHRLRERCRQCDVVYRVPKGDADGRWNTVYDMLTVFTYLREPLRLLCFDDARLMVSWPTPHEWDMISRFSEILRQYKEATLVMESEWDAGITWAFPMMDSLMSAVERFERTGVWGDEAVQQALQLSWETLRKYYHRMNQSVYYVCLFLDPQVKTCGEALGGSVATCSR